VGEQEIDIVAELDKIVLAGMTGEKELKESVASLCGMYDIESDAPSAIDVAVEFQKLKMEVGTRPLDEYQEQKLCDILAKALSVSTPLDIPLPLD
jgi:hypothetical protein